MQSSRVVTSTVVLAILSFMATGEATFAQSNPPSSLAQDVDRLVKSGDVAAAEKLVSERVAHLRQNLPTTAVDYLAATEIAVQLKTRRSDTKGAVSVRRDIVEALVKSQAKSEQIGSARLALAQLLSSQKLVDAPAEFEKAHDDYVQAEGPESRSALLCSLYLGLNYSQANDFARAERVWSKVAPLVEKVHGVDSFQQELVLGQWGLALYRLEKNAEARQTLERAIRVCQTRRKGPSQEEGQLHENLGMVFLQLGQLQAARDEFESEATVYLQSLGEEHQLYGWALALYGDKARMIGPRDLARQALDLALKILDKSVGKSSAQSRYVLAARTELAVDERRYNEAETDSIEWSEREFVSEGRIGLQTVLARKWTATIARMRGDFRGHSAQLEKLIAEFEPKTPAEVIAKSELLETLADGLSVLGQKADALVRAKQAVSILEEAKVVAPIEMIQRMLKIAELESPVPAGNSLDAAQTLADKHQLAESLQQALIWRLRATLASRTADYAGAESWYRRTAQLMKRVVGENDVRYADQIASLAAVQRAAGKLEAAEKTLKEHVELVTRFHGPNHDSVISSLTSLGTMANESGHNNEAMKYLTDARQRAATVPDKNSQQHAYVLFALGPVLARTGKQAEGIAALKECAAICEESGLSPLRVSAMKIIVAILYRSLQFDEADAAAEAAQIVAEQVFGSHSLEVSDILIQRAQIARSRSETSSAVELATSALTLRRLWLNSTLDGLSDRQQLLAVQKVRDGFDELLSLPDSSSMDGISAEVIASKGEAFIRQRALRNARQNQETAKILPRLRQVSGELGAFAFDSGDIQTRTSEQANEMKRLWHERDQLQAELARQASGSGTAPRKSIEILQGVRKNLPLSAVLVDFIEYSSMVSERVADGSWVGKRVRFIDAFIIPGNPEQAIVRVHVGRSDEIGNRISAWRGLFADGSAVPPGFGPVAQQAGAWLRKQIWEPISQHFTSPDVVLIAADGPLLRLPFTALPGEKPGSFLIEDVPLAILPTPQLLDFAHPVSASKSDDQKILLVGGVDFDRAAASPNSVERPQSANFAADGKPRHFENLLGSKSEVRAIEQILSRSKVSRPAPLVLTDSAPTRNAVLSALPKAKLAHLATHGYFASRSFEGTNVSETNFGDAGVLSGLVLAGANRHDAATIPIVTAIDLVDLDLNRTELIVLSACETGLGEAFGGEGLIGLQRALHVAGANAVISSLWSVHDAGTRVLMERFYENLWNENQSSFQALRNAQLWVLRHPQEFRAALDHATRSDPQSRGLKQIFEQPLAAGMETTPPYYWAAFVHSGDWR